MKKLLLLATLLLATTYTHAQAGNAVIILFPGVPSGACSSIMLGVASNGDFYTCPSGTFVLKGSGASVPTPPGGADTQVQFNDGGVFGGDAGLTFDKTNEILTQTTSIGGVIIIDTVLGPGGGTNRVDFFPGGMDINTDKDFSGGGGDAFAMSGFYSCLSVDCPGTSAGLDLQYGADVSVGRTMDAIANIQILAGNRTGAGALTNYYGIRIGDLHTVGDSNAAISVANQGTAAGDLAISVEGGNSDLGPNDVKVGTLSTNTNCASAGGTCGSAASGAFTIAAAVTTATVSTTAVHATSRIEISENSTLGAALGVTCNTTVIRTYAVSTVTANTSFVVTSSAAPAANPACLTYSIVN